MLLLPHQHYVLSFNISRFLLFVTIEYCWDWYNPTFYIALPFNIAWQWLLWHSQNVTNPKKTTLLTQPLSVPEYQHMLSVAANKYPKVWETAEWNVSETKRTPHGNQKTANKCGLWTQSKFIHSFIHFTNMQGDKLALTSTEGCLDDEQKHWVPTWFS